MSYLALPHTPGWIVMFREERTFPARNGRPEYRKEVDSSCCFRRKEDAEKKAEELKARGATIRGITECIF